MMRTIFWMMILAVNCPAFAEDLPSGSRIIYRGAQDSAHDYVYYRSTEGSHHRLLVRNHDDSKVSEYKYPHLMAFREALQGIDDFDGLLYSPLWLVDTDGDGFSDMREYLTNGDPYLATVYPTETTILSFSNGIIQYPVPAVKDMEGGEGETNSGGSQKETETVIKLDRIERLLTSIVQLLAVFVGLFFWRLFILSKSQKNMI